MVLSLKIDSYNMKFKVPSKKVKNIINSTKTMLFIQNRTKISTLNIGRVIKKIMAVKVAVLSTKLQICELL
jgi:hypothetical protein